MLVIQNNYSLKDLNGYRVSARAKFYAKIQNTNELSELINNDICQKEKKFILGQGCNTLFVDDFDGLVINIDIQGKEIIYEDNNNVIIKLGAGEDWPKFVEFCLKNNWSGIENLAGIPGTAGAAVVQNIAAYGHHFADSFLELEAINLDSGNNEIFSKEKCGFGYRTSFFKNELKKKYLIVNVTLKLNKEFKIEYDFHDRNYSLKSELEEFAREPYNIKDIYQAVVNLRSKKLPSIDEYGACGSVFMNPKITVAKYKELSKKISELQFYPIEGLIYKDFSLNGLKDNDLILVPAGRLLEELGWKNKWIGNVGTFEKHALQVVTNGRASGQEVYDFIKKMQESVMEAYGIELEPEVNIVR